jgi:hypothetical protein
MKYIRSGFDGYVSSIRNSWAESDVIN